MSKLTIGFVGAGWMGGALLRRLSQRDDVDIKYLLSRDSHRAGELLATLGLTGTQVASHYDQLTADPTIDAVCLASPNHLHGPQSIQAMRAGKHVFCEKPCATRFGEFVQQVELEQANASLVTFVDYILYFDSFEQRLRKMIADGAFGRISQIQVNYRHPINVSGARAWKLSQEMMGDAIGMGINHALSVMVFAMASQAKPIGVFATSMPAQVRGFEAHCIWNILVRFDNGAAGFCFGNIDTSNGYDAYHSIRGDRGELIFDGRLDHQQKIRFCSTSVADGRWIYPLDGDRCRRDGVDPWPSDTTTPDSGDVIQHQTRECIRHFVECARSGVRSPLSFSNTAVIAEVGWAALMSSASGREIPIPLDRAAAAHFFDQGLCPGGRAS